LTAVIALAAEPLVGFFFEEGPVYGMNIVHSGYCNRVFSNFGVFLVFGFGPSESAHSKNEPQAESANAGQL
jgi:hypothetical protein